MSELFVHIPASIFAEKVPFLLSRRLQPELACQDAALDQLDFYRIGDSAARLAAAGLKTILHAPYVNFHPGSPVPQLRKMTIKLLEQSLLLAERVSASKIVFHPGLAPDSTALQQSIWLENSLELWPNYISWAEQNHCTFCIENIYESSPQPLLRLVSAIDSPRFGHVFDIGHWNIFSGQRLTDWLIQMGPYLQHLHLHDNHGDTDDHLAIGLGTVPFAELFSWLEKTAIEPSITLENHNLRALDQSLVVIKNFTAFA